MRTTQKEAEVPNSREYKQNSGIHFTTHAVRQMSTVSQRDCINAKRKSE